MGNPKQPGVGSLPEESDGAEELSWLNEVSIASEGNFQRLLALDGTTPSPEERAAFKAAFREEVARRIAAATHRFVAVIPPRDPDVEKE